MALFVPRAYLSHLHNKSRNGHIAAFFIVSAPIWLEPQPHRAKLIDNAFYA